jgi:hypothetical protein
MVGGAPVFARLFFTRAEFDSDLGFFTKNGWS